MKNTLKTSLLATLLLTLTACGSAVSQSNYDKIKDGMTIAEVEAILGPPTEKQSTAGAAGNMGLSGQQSVWKSGDKSISVAFLNGKVMMKSQQNL